MIDHISFLDREHTELLEKLQQYALNKGRLGTIFSQILAIFSYHLDREEETVIPLLAYLKERMGRKKRPNLEYFRKISSEFDNEFENMIKEHLQIEDLCQDAITLAGTDCIEIHDLSGSLRRHMLLEEQLLYPAAQAATFLLEREVSGVIQ